MIGTEGFTDAQSFVKAFAKMIVESFEMSKSCHENNLPDLLQNLISNPGEGSRIFEMRLYNLFLSEEDYR